MSSPNAEHAIIDIRTLRDYCFLAWRRAARLFVAALGMTAEDAEDLRALLLQAVKTSDGQLQRRDAYGQRHTP